jgi:hypothetical protein
MTEYVARMVFLQGATATFQALELQQQGRITLNYNQFVYAAACSGYGRDRRLGALRALS